MIRKIRFSLFAVAFMAALTAGCRSAGKDCGCAQAEPTPAATTAVSS